MRNNETGYSPKEIAAFEGLFRLTREGRSFSSLKVQDIATEAGVGKGTLYEYFSSKEEILTRAILYVLDDTLQTVEATLEQAESFCEALTCVFRKIFYDSESVALPVLIGMLTWEKRFDLLQENADCAHALKQRMCAQEQRLLALGRHTGEIDPALDDTFCEYVIVSAIIGEIGAARMGCPREKDERQEPYPVRLICRALRS